MPIRSIRQRIFPSEPALRQSTCGLYPRSIDAVGCPSRSSLLLVILRTSHPRCGPVRVKVEPCSVSPVKSRTCTSLDAENAALVSCSDDSVAQRGAVWCQTRLLSPRCSRGRHSAGGRPDHNRPANGLRDSKIASAGFLLPCRTSSPATPPAFCLWRTNGRPTGAAVSTGTEVLALLLPRDVDGWRMNCSR